MAYATYSDVSNFMQLPAFSDATTPTSTVVTAGIVLADSLIDNYLQGRTATSGALKLASCMIVQAMIMRARRSIAGSEEALPLAEPLMTREAKEVLDRDMDTSSEIPIRVSNVSSYQTANNPDDFV